MYCGVLVCLCVFFLSNSFLMYTMMLYTSDCSCTCTCRYYLWLCGESGPASKTQDHMQCQLITYMYIYNHVCLAVVLLSGTNVSNCQTLLPPRPPSPGSCEPTQLWPRPLHQSDAGSSITATTTLSRPRR